MIVVFENNKLKEPISFRFENIISFSVETCDKECFFAIVCGSGKAVNVPLGGTPNPEFIYLAIAYAEALGVSCLFINEYDFAQTLANLTAQIASQSLRQESILWKE